MGTIIIRHLLWCSHPSQQKIYINNKDLDNQRFLLNLKTLFVSVLLKKFQGLIEASGTSQSYYLSAHQLIKCVVHGLL